MYITATSNHPDLIYKDRLNIQLKIQISEELEQLELAYKNVTSAAEKNYLDIKKMELFYRIFGF